MKIPFTKLDIGIATRNSSTQRSWAATDNRWYSPFPWVGKNGSQIATPETATQIPALFTGVKILSETVGSVPLIIYKRTSDEGRERAKDHPLYSILKDLANPNLTAMEFKEMMTHHMILRGNGFAQIVRNNGGDVIGLYPLHPSRMSLEFDNELLDYVYVYTLKSGLKKKMLREEIFHLRGPSEDGLWGISFVQSLKSIIEHNMTLDEYANNFYINNAAPSGVLQMAAGVEMSAKAKDNLRDEWKKKYQGASSGSVAILEEGLTWQQIGMTSQDSQFIDTLKDARLQILGGLRVAPYLAGDTDKLSFNSVEQLSIQFINYTMLPYFTRWQQTIHRDLFSSLERKKYYVEFLIEVLQKGDFITRYRGYAVGRQWGWLSVNDIRKFENMNPVESGDVYLQPMNMVDTTMAADFLSDSANSNEKVAGSKSETDDNSNVTLKNSARIMYEPASKAQSLYNKIEQLSAKFDAFLTEKESKSDQKEPKSEGFLGEVSVLLRDSNISVLSDILGRLMRKESAALATAERKNKLDAFDESFYPEHTNFTCESISSAVRSYAEQLVIFSRVSEQKSPNLRAASETTPLVLEKVKEIFEARYKKVGDTKARDFAREIVSEIERISFGESNE